MVDLLTLLTRGRTRGACYRQFTLPLAVILIFDRTHGRLPS